MIKITEAERMFGIEFSINNEILLYIIGEKIYENGDWIVTLFDDITNKYSRKFITYKDAPIKRLIDKSIEYFSPIINDRLLETERIYLKYTLLLTELKGMK